MVNNKHICHILECYDFVLKGTLHIHYGQFYHRRHKIFIDHHLRLERDLSPTQKKILRYLKLRGCAFQFQKIKSKLNGIRPQNSGAPQKTDRDLFIHCRKQALSVKQICHLLPLGSAFAALTFY